MMSQLRRNHIEIYSFNETSNHLIANNDFEHMTHVSFYSIVHFQNEKEISIQFSFYFM